MEIKRKIQMSVVTNRRFIIRQMKGSKIVFCKICGEPMLKAEQTAELLDIKQRLIFQLIEQEKLHFTEIEPQTVMVCQSSMSAILSQDLQSLKTNNK